MNKQGAGTTTGDNGGPTPVNLEKAPGSRGGDTRNNTSTSPANAAANKGQANQPRGLDHHVVARKLRQDYAHGARDPNIRHLDAIHSLIKYLMSANPNLDEMLAQTARLIYTQFSIKEVSVALRSTSDGLYRYVAEHGMRADIWAAHDKITYTYDDLIDTKKYKPITISHNTQLFLAEDNPYGVDESDTYSQHLMRQSKRKSDTDSIEGDYIDVFLYGPHEETLGWIEISGTWDSKIPDARTIRCLEIVASILAIAVTRHRLAEEPSTPKEGTAHPKKIDQPKK